MTEMKTYAPPKHSFVDDVGRRFIVLDIDIMLCNGERFFTTFRYKAPVRLDFGLGTWCIDADGLPNALIDKYAFLRNRNDVRICLSDAKVVKQFNTKNNEKNSPNRRIVGKQFKSGTCGSGSSRMLRFRRRPEVAGRIV